MLKKLMQSIREYKLPSILTFIFILLEAVIECIIPYITANLVNAVEDGAELSAVMKTGGVLIADNTLYKSMTPDPEHVVRRKITIVKRLRKFIDAINSRPDLDTCVLSVGDGVTVSVKTDCGADCQ